MRAQQCLPSTEIHRSYAKHNGTAVVVIAKNIGRTEFETVSASSHFCDNFRATRLILAVRSPATSTKTEARVRPLVPSIMAEALNYGLSRPSTVPSYAQSLPQLCRISPVDQINISNAGLLIEELQKTGQDFKMTFLVTA